MCGAGPSMFILGRAFGATGDLQATKSVDEGLHALLILEDEYIELPDAG